MTTPERRQRSNWELTKDVLIALIIATVIGGYSWSKDIEESVITLKADHSHIERLVEKVDKVVVDVAKIKGYLMKEEDNE